MLSAKPPSKPPIDRAQLKKRAVWYYGRYFPSELKLSQYLHHYIAKLCHDVDERRALAQAIPDIVSQIKAHGVDDETLGRAYLDQYQRRGLSHQRIRDKLQRLGFATEPESYDSEQESAKALKFAQKKNLRRYDRVGFMNRMVRAGFAVDIAAQTFNTIMHQQDEDQF